VLLKHGLQPTSVLVDLPCTLFMIDNRNLTVVEDMAQLIKFSPAMTARTLPFCWRMPQAKCAGVPILFSATCRRAAAGSSGTF
jgi:hypothetical protein